MAHTATKSDRVRRWEERCVSAVAYNPSFAGRQFVPSARAVAEERLLLPCMIWGHALGKAGPQSSLPFRISVCQVVVLFADDVARAPHTHTEDS